jgi:hypothetical protein
MKENMGQFDFESIPAGPHGGLQVLLRFHAFGLSDEVVPASEVLATEREIDERVAKLKVSLDAAAVLAKAALQAGRPGNST